LVEAKVDHFGSREILEGLLERDIQVRGVEPKCVCMNYVFHDGLK